MFNSFQCNNALSIRYAKLNITITLLYSVMRGYCFRTKGGRTIAVKGGYMIKSVDFCGGLPPTFRSKRGD